MQGTLDMLILKAVSLGPLHGYGVLLRIQQISEGPPGNSARLALSRAVSAGTPRLDRKRMGRIGEQTPGQILSSHGRGQRRFQAEAEKWNRMAGVIAGILSTTPEEV